MNDKKKKLVSIIIPLYNSGKYILECVDSCMRQSYDNIEIIVVDDGSTDDGFELVSEIEKKYKKLHVIRTKNNGVSSARNLGLEKACGDYICFVDADDCIDEKFVETMISYMEEFGADFCFSENIWSKTNNNKVPPKMISSSDAEALLLGPKIKVGCWNKMYAANIVRDVRFDTDLFYGEGLYFINQVAHRSKKIVVCGDGLYRYKKVNPESATTKFDINKMINGEKALFRIRKLIRNDGKKVNRTWAQHYCRFCLMTIRGILESKGCKVDYKKWRNKMKNNIVPALLSDCSFNEKMKLLAVFISPKLYKVISER